MTINYPDLDVWARSATCALDVADQGEVAEMPVLCGLLQRSYDRGHQVLVSSVRRAREVAEELGEVETPWEASQGKQGKPSTLAALATPARRPTIHDVRGRISGVPMPELPPLPYRRPSPEEVARLYPGAAISVEYGQPRPQPTGLGDPPHEGEPTARFWAADQDRAIKGWGVRFALDREKRHRQQEEARRQDELQEAPEDPGPVSSG